MTKLLQSIEGILRARWNARLPSILEQAEQANSTDATKAQVYKMAWREAYMAAVEDMTDAGLLQEREPISASWEPQPAIDGVH